MHELTVAEWLEDAAIEAAALYCSRASTSESLWPGGGEPDGPDDRGAAADMLTLANTSLRLRDAIWRSSINMVGP